MRLLGYDLSATPSPNQPVSLFGGEPFAITKAVPPGATIDESASERLRTLADAARSGAALGTAAPATGIRPNPGALPALAPEVEADPLRFQIPWGANLAYTPRSGYGTPFSILRSLAASAPVIALCIQCRKDQMAALDWDFAPRDKKAKESSVQTQIEQARAFFAKPDGRRSHKSWLQLLVDEALTIDAVAIYKRPTRLGAAKLTQNPAYLLSPAEIATYDVIDGTTIKIELDGQTGDLPLPPQVAYRQIIQGAPIRGGDLTLNQLMYRPKTERTWTPYGLSPIEAALLIVTADLNRSLFNLSYYSEGNIPEALVGVPNTWSPKQIGQFNEYWNLVLAGDPKNRSKLRFVAETMAKTVHEFRKPDFTTAYDLWLLKMQCAMFGVTPSEIGFTDDVNKATSKTQGDVNQRRGVKPMANYLKRIHDEILMDLGLGALEATWSGGEGEDALTQARIIDLNLRNARISLDEIRAEDGRPTLGAGPAVYTATGPVFVEDAIALSAAAGVPDTGGADDPDEPLPGAADPAVTETAQQAELKKYQQVATKAVKAGKAVPAFTTTILAPLLHKSLIRALATASTVADVQQIFGTARTRVLKAQRLSAAQKKHQTQMTAKLTAVLAAERRAIAAHVAAGLDA